MKSFDEINALIESMKRDSIKYGEYCKHRYESTKDKQFAKRRLLAMEVYQACSEPEMIRYNEATFEQQLKWDLIRKKWPEMSAAYIDLDMIKKDTLQSLINKL